MEETGDCKGLTLVSLLLMLYVSEVAYCAFGNVGRIVCDVSSLSPHVPKQLA